jgi:hypothetical protein
MALTEGANSLQIAEGLRCNLGNLNWVEVQYRHSAFQGITCIRTEAHECPEIGRGYAGIPRYAFNFLFGT